MRAPWIVAIDNISTTDVVGFGLPHTCAAFFLNSVLPTMKRPREEETVEDRPEKRLRAPSVDRLSRLSDELLLRVLSFVPVPTLNTCQR